MLSARKEAGKYCEGVILSKSMALTETIEEPYATKVRAWSRASRASLRPIAGYFPKEVWAAGPVNRNENASS